MRQLSQPTPTCRTPVMRYASEPDSQKRAWVGQRGGEAGAAWELRVSDGGGAAGRLHSGVAWRGGGRGRGRGRARTWWPLGHGTPIFSDARRVFISTWGANEWGRMCVVWVRRCGRVRG